MANIYDHKPRNCKRIDYVLKIRGKRIPRTKYAPDDAEARILQRQVEAVKSAVRTGIAAIDDIEEWIDKKWIKPQEAEDAFRGFKESLHRKQRHDTQATDYDLLGQECLKYAADVTSGSGAEIRNHANRR